MTLKQTLQIYAGHAGHTDQSSQCPTSADIRTAEELPASILDWPQEWRKRFEATTEAVSRLLPIDAFYAEAAAEIAVRLEYDARQDPPRSNHRPLRGRL